ncbi:MAG: DeoR/GlpR family DNA-binding transcription regulator [Lachnospiraceae bacterium]|nr:DeoR/GlpR family DNA-binding transcription regulator [Lachnospiraceae bacterium]
MLPGQRHYLILELLMKNKSISVKTLCDELEASEATIRRDLTVLESEGKLERTHGGAVLRYFSTIDQEESFNQKESMLATQKQRIAQKAFELLKENESIILDAGTTALELANLIGKSNLKISVITNSTTISKYIGENRNAELFIVGGKVRLNTLATVGSLAIDTVKKFNVSKTFIGVNGITLDSGLTTPDFEESQIKNAMLSVGRERIVLTDHTKFDKVAVCRIAPISMIDCIITDKDIDPKYMEEFEANDCKMILA